MTNSRLIQSRIDAKQAKKDDRRIAGQAKKNEIRVKQDEAEAVQNDRIIKTGNRNLLYGVQALSDFLRCPTATAQNLISNRKIPYMKVGQKYIFNQFKVLKALEHKQKSINNRLKTAT